MAGGWWLWLSAPLLEDRDLREIHALKNGEIANTAINRMIGRSSRELKEIYGVTSEYSLTNMDTFLQGVVEVTEALDEATTWQPAAEVESWVIRPLDDSGTLMSTVATTFPQTYHIQFSFHFDEPKSATKLITW